MWFKQRMENQGLVNNSQLRMPVSCTYPQGFESFHLASGTLFSAQEDYPNTHGEKPPTTNLEVSLSTHEGTEDI